jgi:hypothetical protein
MTCVILGADPGIAGGLAVVGAADNGGFVLLGVIDIPIVGTGAKQRVNVAGVREFILRHQPTAGLIERAGSMPRQGIASAFKYGRATGSIEATIVLCGLPIEIVEPSVWKRHWRLPGKDKEASRQRALEMFPDAHSLLARKKDHGRAESMLIAAFGLRTSRVIASPAARGADAQIERRTQ